MMGPLYVDVVFMYIYFFIEYLKCIWKSNCIWIIQNDSKKKKKSKDRVSGSGFSLRVGFGTATRAVTFLVVSEPRFRRFYKMIFEIVYDMHCICI